MPSRGIDRVTNRRGRPESGKAELRMRLNAELVVRAIERGPEWVEGVLRAALDGPPAAPPPATALVVVKPDRANSDAAPRSNKPKGSPPAGGGLASMLSRREQNNALWRRLNAK